MMKKKFVQASRPHDCLYDPTFHVSTETDHWKAVATSNRRTGAVTIVPHEVNMFSEIPRKYPSKVLKLSRVDPVPNFVPRAWADKQDYNRQIISDYTQQNYAPGVTVPSKTFDAVQPDGRDGFRYFHRPLVPYQQQMQPTSVVFGQPKGLSVDPRDIVPQPAVKTVAVQTDYRESEAQTDPWSPEVTFLPGTEPEELLLANVKFGRGLPVGVTEVGVIEQARLKRVLEKNLPRPDDPAYPEKRREMLEKMNRDDWLYREKQIEKLQTLRLRSLRKGLDERDEKHHQADRQKLMRRWRAQEEEREKKTETVRHRHRIALRQLLQKHSNPENKLERRDIIHDYDSAASQAFAPLTRVGVFPDCALNADNVSSRFLNTYEGITELENDLPDFIFDPTPSRPRRFDERKGSKAAKQRRYNKHLKDAYDATQQKLEVEEGSMRLLEKVPRPKIRPPTPTVSTPDDEKAALEMSVVHIQRIVRGRATQYKMRAELQEYRDFIDEVKAANALQDDLMPDLKAKRTEVLEGQRTVERQEAFKADAEMSAQHFLQHDIGSAVDFYSKELQRLKEERRIHALILLANRQRRTREAAEAGKRQKEIFHQQRDDEVFRQLMKVEKSSIDDYLREFVIKPSVHTHAQSEADAAVDDMIKAVSNFNTQYEEKTGRMDALNLAARLVHTYLIPEPEKAAQRRQLKQDQERLIRAAHQTLYTESRGQVGNQDGHEGGGGSGDGGGGGDELK